MKEKPLDQEVNYLKDHADIIKPALDSNPDLKDYFDQVVRDHGNVDAQKVREVIEDVETQVFLLEKNESEYDALAKRVLLSSSDPLEFKTACALMDHLRQDRRCRGVGFLTDGVGGQDFKKVFKNQSGKTQFKSFKGDQVFGKDEDDESYDRATPVLYDALKTAENSPYDVALVPLESSDTPSGSLLYSAKSTFGAKKLYLIFDGWGGMTADSSFVKNFKKMDEIDGIMCNDELAQKILQHQLPEELRSKILVTGTPVTDSLELDRAEEYAQNGRDRLNLKPEDIAVLFLGDISTYHKTNNQVNPRINEETFSQTLAAMIEVAQAQPEKKFSLLLRPHPRDPNKEELFALSQQSLPENLKIITAGRDEVSMQEAAYAADIITSIVSTESFLAPTRGKRGVFLGYKQSGLGGKVLEGLYGSDLVKSIDLAKNFDVVSEPKEFFQLLADYQRSSEESPERSQSTAGNSINRIMDIALKD